MSLVLVRSQTDERLVVLARQGHERAFEAIVRRYRRPLLSACRRMVPDAQAEDVLQQALVAAWTALRRGDDVRDVRAWLFGIVRNTAVSTLRRSGHDPPALIDALAAAPSSQEEAERRALVHDTLATIARLPERQREALMRIAVHGDSQDDVAGDLGVSRTATRALVHRARTTLRAAASALMPLPILTWLASAGTEAEPISLRIAKLVAGAGGAGATTTLVKAGAVAGVAAAISAPVIADHHAPKTRPGAAPAAHTRHAEKADAAPARSPAAVPVRYTPPVVGVRRQAGGGHAGGRRSVAEHVRTGERERRHREDARSGDDNVASDGRDDASRGDHEGGAGPDERGGTSGGGDHRTDDARADSGSSGDRSGKVAGD